MAKLRKTRHSTKDMEGDMLSQERLEFTASILAKVVIFQVSKPPVYEKLFRCNKVKFNVDISINSS
jgi:hypothetical protein